MSKIKSRKNVSGGSAGAGGYGFQASAIAYVASYILAKKPLEWIEHFAPDIPVSVATETGKIGDDLKIILKGGISIELQAKTGISKGEKFWNALLDLSRGLSRNPKLYAVFLTDNSASTTIRQELRKDLLRLSDGRMDQLKQITKEFLSKLKSEKIDVNKIFSRLRIIVLDFYSGAPAESTAKTILSALVVDGKQDRITWNTLVKDGIDLIKKRGMRDSDAFVALLHRSGITLKALSKDPGVLLKFYSTWLQRITNTFTITGLDIALPIAKVWIKLSANVDMDKGDYNKDETTEQILAKYHQYGQSLRSEKHTKVMDAEHLLDFFNLVVVMGGPGMGKTTLLKRLANSVSSTNKPVIYVRLPFVSKLMEQGCSFEEAIIKTSGDGSGIPFNDLRELLKSPEYLLADGFDECGSYRNSISDAICAWAHGHKKTKIIITTRPIGDNFASFPGWRNVELLPLKSEEISNDVSWILDVYFNGETKHISSELKKFEDRIKKSQFASLSARNPLFLGFLIKLSISSQQFSEKRAEILYQIIELMRCSDPQGRTYSTKIDCGNAWRFLEIFGYLLQQKSVMTSLELIDCSAEIMAKELGCPVLESKKNAEIALGFWEERRLIEILTVGNYRITTFVHLAFCEFAAGRYIAKLSNKGLDSWLQKNRKLTKWKECILLAAGSSAGQRIIRQLMHLDNSKDPCSTEAMLAATAYLESSGIPLSLTKKLAENLLVRLSSYIPLICCEATDALLELAKSLPPIMGPFVKKLQKHKQPWTRLCACILAILSGKKYVDLDILIKIYDEIDDDVLFSKASYDLFASRSLNGLRSRFIESATEFLLREKPNAENLERIDRKLCSSISMSTHKNINKLLRKTGFDNSVPFSKKQSAGYLLQIRQWSEWFEKSMIASRKADEVLLKAILNATRTMKSTSQNLNITNRKMVALSAIFEVMDIAEMPGTDYEILSREDDRDALVTVLKGIIVVTGVSPKSLYSDAIEALRLLKKENKSIFNNLKQIVIEPDWSKARKIKINPSSLVNALKHPSKVVAYNAGILLRAGAGGQKAAEFIRELLRRGSGFTLGIISIIAKDIWGNKAPCIILKRLDGDLSKGCDYLFSILPLLNDGNNTQRILKSLLRGVRAGSPDIALGAAHALTKIEINKSCELRVRQALEYWKLHEPPYPKEGGIIPKSPRAELVKVLAKIGALKFNEMIIMIKDIRHDVRDEACKTLVDFVSTNKNELIMLLKMIDRGDVPALILNKIIDLDVNVLKNQKFHILKLLKSSIAEVRRISLSFLTKDLFNRTESLKLLKKCLKDPDGFVRNQAVLILRQLMDEK
jgi:hypothetical protein